MVTCMNDRYRTYPRLLFNPQYSQFCYEIPFMLGKPSTWTLPLCPRPLRRRRVNNPDCSYPVLTPAIKEVDGDGIVLG